MDKLAIIGNGPSRSLFEGSGDYDYVIGCNYVPYDVDYSVYVDAYAARLMREGQKFHDRIGSSMLVFGERCAEGLRRIKARPASTDTLFQYFVSRDVVYCDEGRHDIAYPSVFRRDQRYLSSGHLAFLFACKEFMNPTIHLFGFDSVLTGDHLASFSNRDIREWPNPHTERKVLDKPRVESLVWQENWNLMFDHCAFEGAYFHGYKEDSELPFFDQRVEAAYH